MKGLSTQTLTCGSCSGRIGMIQSGKSWQKIIFPARATLIHHPHKGWILFDTGYAEHFFTYTQAFPERIYRIATPVSFKPNQSALSQLASLGISTADIQTLILSHFHGDHIGGLRDFPHANIIYHEEAFTAYQQLSRFQQVRKGYIHQLLPLDFIKRGHALLPSDFTPWQAGLFAKDLLGDDSLWLVHLPGHAPGHCGLWVNSETGPEFHLADAAWFREELDAPIPLTRFARSILHDVHAYAETQQKLRNLLSLHPTLRWEITHSPHRS